MEESKVSILEDIDRYVEKTLAALSEEQKSTLRVLLLSGYKGERDYVVVDLLKRMGLKGIAEGDLVESFVSSYEGDKARYYRIKPEFFRSVRKQLTKGRD